MKIISKETFHSDIDFILQKDLLIPCFVYKIPIEISKDKSLNFIEETILKLIQVDNSLKNDIDRLSEMLGFCKKNEKKECIKDDSDRRKIIKLILQKIKDLEINNEENKPNTEVIVYQFYQEAYTNELLPIITKEINEFSYPETDYPYNDTSQRKISFKKEINSKSPIKAILANGYSKNNSQLTKSDVIKTIHKHNQSNYKESHTINYKSFKIEMVNKPELIYLHTKLFILRNSIESIVITNGFTNDFSTTLRRIFENRHFELLKTFRYELRQDIEKQKQQDIDLPFDNNIKRYGNIVKEIKNIEKYINILYNPESKKIDIKNAKDHLAQSLYDVVEALFSILSTDLEAHESLKNRDLLYQLAKDAGFEVYSKKNMSIFNVHDNDNLQKYLAKSLFYKKNELYEIALQYPKFLIIINKLFSFRNGLKHSQKEDTLQRINENVLFAYKEMIYNIISIVLKIKQKDTKQVIINDDNDIYQNNAYIALEEEFGLDIVNQLPQEVKENLVEINYWLNEMEFESNKSNIVTIVLNNIYSSLELLLRKKDDKLPDRASLGYISNYIQNDKSIDSDNLKLIQEVVLKRGHGTQKTVEELATITEKELRNLKDNSFKYIQKLMEEV